MIYKDFLNGHGATCPGGFDPLHDNQVLGVCRGRGSAVIMTVCAQHSAHLKGPELALERVLHTLATFSFMFVNAYSIIAYVERDSLSQHPVKDRLHIGWRGHDNVHAEGVVHKQKESDLKNCG